MDSTVSMQSFYDNALATNQYLTKQLTTMQTQAATGQNYAQVSDNPTASVEILSQTDQQARLTTNLSNIQTATSALNASVSALQQVDSIFTQAKSLAVQASSSTNDTSSFSTMATLVNAMITNMLDLANSQNNGVYLFSGTASKTQPFVVTNDASGQPASVTYQGSDGATSTVVDDNQKAAVTAPGNQVFQSATANAFQSLIDLRNLLQNTGNLSSTDQITAISNQITALDNADNQVLNTIGQQSTTLQSLSTLQSHVQNLQLSSQETTSNLADVNMTTLAVQLQTYEQLLQVSLESFAQINSTNLMNYLK